MLVAAHPLCADFDLPSMPTAAGEQAHREPADRRTEHDTSRDSLGASAEWPDPLDRSMHLPSSGKQCCVSGLVRSSVPHGSGGVGTASAAGAASSRQHTSAAAAAADHTDVTGRAIAQSAGVVDGALGCSVPMKATLGGAARR